MIALRNCQHIRKHDPCFNKYAEGYSGRRYYGGCEHIDVVETLAIDRAKQLFGAAFVNAPHSGAQANQAVFLSAEAWRHDFYMSLAAVVI